ncbi:hypothetical protein [Amaricoccus sp.]|uniref:hypothetical protein n=1 Tax=Amaricoccus sp. TaxID=1872485 RepID=UPI001B75B323|nr:hypothetical protein [Amaricoccus sp.]MBP7243372.1 hypothetical protein [Amaricoccus sp.]
MSAFRLQIFEPAGDRGPAPGERALAEAREEAWRAGFLAGQAQATEAHLAEQSRLTSEFVEALCDARLTNEAARRHVAASLAPFAGAIVAALTPALAEAGLAAEAVARVEQALAAAPEAKPVLRCAPELVPVIRGLLAERGLAATVEAAPELLPREAALHWDQGYDRIDLDACADELRACVASHVDPEPEQIEERRYG